VDDEEDLVAPLALRLSRAALFEVECAYDGDDGLRRALERPPDAALIDVSMPGLDGWELCRRLRSEPLTSAARIVIMTAWVSKDLEKRARDEGASRLLLKPFEDADLLEALGAGPAKGQ
jgi:CheY-like chemotaxis protein